MTQIAPDWLTAAPTQAVMTALAPARPLFVGGCVRDALMARPSEDVDIAVATPPDETMTLATAAGLKTIATGVDHGVVTVVADGHAYEIATLRRDVETDGRRAVVAFTDQIDQDAARRDFTMNALYADRDGRVLDPLGEGLADLKARRIRFIGDAKQRIREDYLRILRFFRFHAQFGINDFDADATADCIEERRGLDLISAERIGTEMKKLLTALDPGLAMAALGPILHDILPDAAWPECLIEAEADWDLAPEPIRRLAALRATSVDRLRLSKAELRGVQAIKACEGMKLGEAVYRHGAEAAIDMLAILGVPHTDQDEQIAKAQAAVFPITAQHLMDQGIPPGPKLGDMLAKLEEKWITSDFEATRETLLRS